jgi:membrane associated rhomboid family serine protease
MIPLRDVLPSRTTPWIAFLLIASNLLMFGVQLAGSPDRTAAVVRALGLAPADFSWAAAVTSMFVHAGWLHLTGNVALLWLFGENVESRMGHARFLLFYLLTGLAAGAAQTAFHPASLVPLVGASGATAGIIGAYMVLFPDSRILVLFFARLRLDLVEVPAVFFAAVWFALQAASSAGQLSGMPGENLGLPGLAGGCVAGVVGGWLLKQPVRWDLD